MDPSIAAGPAETVGSRSAATGTTRTLLMAGVLAGPVFYLVFIAQLFIRPGFDIRRHALSRLSLGELGWIQITSFIITGLLGIVSAAGVRRALHPGRAGTWGPILVGLWGVGLTAAGLFTADPGLGFPPGNPVTASSHLSWHAMLHGAAFFTAFTSSTAACSRSCAASPASGGGDG